MASTGNALAALAGMAAFTLGTAPALMLVAMGSGWALKRFQPKVKMLSRMIMLLNGMVLLVVAGSMVW